MHTSARGIAANGAWSPLFFGAHRPKAAMADLVGNAVALAGYAVEARKVERAAAWMVAPYLGWLGFASWLNGDEFHFLVEGRDDGEGDSVLPVHHAVVSVPPGP